MSYLVRSQCARFCDSVQGNLAFLYKVELWFEKSWFTDNRQIWTSTKTLTFQTCFCFLKLISYYESTLLWVTYSNFMQFGAKLWKFIISWYNFCKFMKQNLTISPNNKLLHFCFYKNMYKSKIAQNGWLYNKKSISGRW